jgi:uncharacterized Zn finger protein
MARENVDAKGRRYVVEGRLLIERVNDARIDAKCRGNGEVWRVGYDGTQGRWMCNCPAIGRCAHLVALQLVTVRPRGQA